VLIQTVELESGLEELTGQVPDDETLTALSSYLELLQRWNRSYNLTAIKDPGEMVVRHLLDSLSIMPWISAPQLLDAGSGAGLPGIPLAIAMPELEVTLLDSAGKKVRFMNHVRRKLDLPNIRPLQARLETFSTGEEFGCIVSRAFSSLSTFAGAARHLAAGPTRLLAMKGRYPEAELRLLPEWIHVETVEKLTVPGLQEERHLVIMSVIA
jgi:16S rRNA (guanine527-N7)-methyltransferase